MSSQGSVSTAQAAGSSGTQADTMQQAASAASAKGNKMKLDMPPRPNKSNSRKANAAATADANGGGANNKTVPHVVRVTFLGVAGLLAKPPTSGTTAEANASSADKAMEHIQSTAQSEQIPSSEQPTAPSTTAQDTTNNSNCTPANPQHASLLFPLPPNLRVVASVSRSRTARGIPSGMSKCLSTSGGGSSKKKEKFIKQHRPTSLLSELVSPSSMAPLAGSFALSPTGESIVPSSDNNVGNDRPNIDEVDISRGDTQTEESNRTNDVSSAKDSLRKSPVSSELAPPSQLLHSRTSSTHRSGRGSKLSGASGGGSVASAGAGQQQQQQQESSSPKPPTAQAKKSPPPLEQNEGIEVIRPISPTALEGGKHNKDIGEGADEDEPERYVAVWDETRKQSTNTTPTTAMSKQKFVNLTNSLAFEAELRPSNSFVNGSTDEGEDDGGRALTPVPSTPFAPKSFCVTVGLVPNFDVNDKGEGSAAPVLDGDEEKNAAKEKGDGTIITHPTFAIPVGFADLVINGDETLDGKRKQIDLPLSSLSNFIGSFGDKVLEKGSYPFPLIELTAEGLGAATNKDETKKGTTDKAAAKSEGKAKKKNIMKRMFSRKQQQPAASPEAAPATHNPPTVYSGPPPKSIFQLDRPPNAKERTLFLDRYSVDPSGDAVVRIGLEVFPRGSELEKIFRQKNKLRKKAQAAAAASGGGRSMSKRDRTRNNNGRYSPSTASLGSRTLDSADSRSLMDDDDMFDSDGDDSIFSQSFFTLDSNASHTTWDESTMYTDALSSFNTIGDDSMSYTTNFTEYKKTRQKRASDKIAKQSTAGNFLTNLLSCNGPTACGVDDEEMRTTQSDNPYANIDTVASAMASMSMAEGEWILNPPAAASARVDDDQSDVMDPMSHIKSIHSVASMDTAKQTTKNGRPVSPDATKESGEELTLGSGNRPPSLDTSIPIDNRTVTITNEISPLAMIKQRVANDDVDDLLGEAESLQLQQSQTNDDEGHEFTLEEHQTSM